MKTISLLQISQNFEKVYIDNCALKYQARNLNDDEAIKNSRFKDKYLDHAKEVIEVLNHNGVIISDVENELLPYIAHIQYLQVDQGLINAYNFIINHPIDNYDYKIHPRAKLYEKWLNSETDKKLFSILNTQPKVALVTNDTNLIRACIWENLSDRIITKVYFHSFYVLTSKPNIFNKLKDNSNKLIL